MVNFTCPKCGAALPVKPGTQLAVCSFCGTPSYIDRREALFFYILPFAIEETAARGIFKRWTAGPACPKDMEASASVISLKKEYFPVFRFRRTVDGKEQVFSRPARGTLLPGMQNVVIPPGDMLIFDSTAKAGGADVLHPDIAVDTYVPALGHDHQTVTVDATCTADGFMTKTCARCGDTSTEVIGAYGHNYTATVTAPTWFSWLLSVS